MNKKGIQYRFKEYNVFTGKESGDVLQNSIIKREKAINLDPEMAALLAEEAAMPVDKPSKPLGDIVDFVRALEVEDKKVMLETLRHPKSNIECK